MRNRTPDSTTPAPALDSADCWVWFVTEKGLRASGAASMKAAAADLRQTAAELEKAARRIGQDMPAPSNGSSAPTDAGGLSPHAPGATAPQVFRRIRVCAQYQNEHQADAEHGAMIVVADPT
jgi:hypothetical protein